MPALLPGDEGGRVLVGACWPENSSGTPEAGLPKWTPEGEAPGPSAGLSVSSLPKGFTCTVSN